MHFGCQIDAMVLPRELYLQPWPRASQTVATLARQQASAQWLGEPVTSFVERVYRELLAGVRHGLTLEEVSGALAISPATCKRKLRAHGYSFQDLHDAVRKHVALYLYWGRGYSSEAVADYLGFHDAANYRRSFKRWTGQLPSVLRQALPHTA